MDGRRSPGRERAASALALAVLLLLVAVAFRDVLSAERGLAFRDHWLEHAGRALGIREAILDGRWPAYTGRDPSGIPLEHLPNPTYTPLTLALLVGPFPAAYDLYVALHFVVLMAGVFALARRLGADRLEATLVAGFAGLAGPVLSNENLLVNLAGLAYAPWVYLGAVRVLEAPTPRRTAALAVAAAFHGQSLLPEFAILDAGALAWLLLDRRDALDRRRLGALALAAAVAVALASVAIFPALETLASTRRGGGFPYATRSGWSLSPGLFVEWVVPSFWAPPEVPFLNVGSITGRASDPPYFVSLYFGSALALAALADLRSRRTWLTFGLLAFFVLVALGRHTPVHRWVTSLPVLTSTRYAVKYMVPVTALLALLVASGLRRAIERPERLIAVALGQVTLLAIALQVVPTEEFRELLDQSLAPYGAHARFADVPPSRFSALAIEAMLPRVHHALGFAALLALAGAAALVAKRRGLARPELFVVAVVLADLAVAGGFQIHGVALADARLPAAVVERIGGPTTRVFSDTNTRLADVHRRPGETHFEARVRSYGRRGRGFEPGLRRYFDLDINGQSNPLHARIFRLAWQAPPTARHRIFARAGVAYVTTASAGLALPEVLAIDVPGEEPERVYAVPDPRPYVSAHTEWAAVDPRLGDRELARRLAEEPRAVLLGSSAPPKRCEREASVTARAVEIGRVEVEVEAPCPALVVAGEVAMAGWRVIVDDREAALAMAEVGYLAVEVPAGRHRVRFEYAPRLGRYLPVALAAVLAVLAMLALPSRRR